MSECLAANMAVLATRWPALAQALEQAPADALNAELVEGLGSTLAVEGIQLSSRHDRLAEAHLQAASYPDAPCLHLYGPGLGDLPRALLQRPVQRLEVYLLNLALFRLVLELLDQSDWLADPRLHLAQAFEGGELRLPFFAPPPELVLADDANAKVRDRLVSELHLAFNNQPFHADAPEIVERLAANAAFLAQDPSVAELFGSRPGARACVLATGPTLEQHFGYLRTLQQQPGRPLLICVDTAYRPLIEQGIVPDIVVTLDQRISQRHLPAQGNEAVTLVYLPLLAPELIQSWRGPRYVACSQSPVYEQLRKRQPMAVLHSAGSVIHPAVDLAVRMGAAEVALLGADFAFPGDRTHAGWLDGELGPTMSDARHWVLDGHGQRVRTQLNFRSYLCELERYIAQHPQVRFINTSRDGAAIAGCEMLPEPFDA